MHTQTSAQEQAGPRPVDRGHHAALGANRFGFAASWSFLALLNAERAEEAIGWELP